MTFSVMANTRSSLAGSDELKFGLRSLRRVCAGTDGCAGWQVFDTQDGLHSALALARLVTAEHVLVILNPALVATATLVTHLQSVALQFPQRVVVAADPRTASGAWQIDYASRAGLERYVARRSELPESTNAERLVPWVFMAHRHTLCRLLEAPGVTSWDDVSVAIRNDALVAQRAFVHSFADYQSSDRRDMLDLVPPEATRLMDVGGGEGWFLSAFQATGRGGGVLVEPSATSADVAQARSLRVANTRFECVTAQAHGRFDCISFLDVLEHMESPLAALEHAKTLLTPGGSVLLSVPNVGHWSVVEDLLEGRFDYLPLGILCCTHLRFFTERSLRELLADAGFTVKAWRNQPSPMPQRMKAGLDAARTAGMALDAVSLETDSFHVLAEVA
jgi:2-polyprenyl-3-methyl-5-hydroxy-6-metoxy-1,4-benzoquinol methylase